MGMIKENNQEGQLSGLSLFDIVHVLVFARRYAVFFFECPEEAGIVAEAEGLIGLGDTHITLNRLLTKRQPLFGDVLVNRDAQIVLEHVGNVVLADEKFAAESFKGKVLLDVSLYKIADGLIEGSGLRLANRVSPLIGHTVQVEDQIIHTEGDQCLTAESITSHLFQKPDQFGLKGVEIDLIIMSDIVFFGAGIPNHIAVVR